MTDNNEPLIKLEPGGKPPILSYFVPEPTSYSGRNFIELTFSDPEEVFKPKAFEKPDRIQTPVKDQDSSTVKTTVMSAMK